MKCRLRVLALNSVGGTLGIRLNHHISLRPIQVDYLLTRLETLTAVNGFETFNQNDFRYGAGIVFNLGNKQ